jgi:hypothetical protein
MQADINKIEEQVIDATEGLRSIRKLLATTTATSERAALVKARAHIGTLRMNAQSLQIELGRALPALIEFLAATEQQQ